jgi:hypothetical protein
MDLLQFFILGDFQVLRGVGRDLLQGRDPYPGGVFFYPLPLGLWLTVPLAALPYEWAVALWAVLSFVSLWLALGKPAALFWASYPFLALMRTGQVDALFIAPLYWLISDGPRVAPVSAALLTLKPQIAWALILYRLAGWLYWRDARRLRVFVIASAIIYAPAFLWNPNWLAEWLNTLSVRAAEPIARIWDLPFPILLALLLAAAGLILTSQHKARLIHLAALTFTPTGYIYDHVAVAGSLWRSWAIVGLASLVSWIVIIAAPRLAPEQKSLWALTPFCILVILWLAERLPQRFARASPGPRSLIDQ